MSVTRLALLACVACTSTATTESRTTTTPRAPTAEQPSETTAAVTPEDPRALFAAQQAALESQDAGAFVQDFDSDAIFIGPVANAVYIGHDAIESALTDVVDASGEISVSANEQHFASLDAVAWSVHDVHIAPAAVEEGAPPHMSFRVSSIYQRSADDWKLVAQAWGVILPSGRYAELSARAGAPAAFEAREDEACTAPIAELRAWLEGTGTVWQDNPEVFAASIAAHQLSATTEPLAASSWTVQPGPGGVRATSLGDGLCLLLNNQVVGSPRPDVPTLPSRLLTLFQGDALRLAHMIAIAPDAPPLPADSEADSEPEAEPEPDPAPEG